ncbi:ABC transporter ATP-binding protein [Amycolatopsis sp. NPDC059021]|uniref:ABC transporter ATP-binding protein n=1 Tax=Amycolatopsis sp. NPDC059021 TaxID=3346704 RepID=UPI00366F40B7
MPSEVPREQRWSHWLRALKLLWSVNPPHVAGVIAATVLTSLVPAATVHFTTQAVQAVANSAGRGDAPEALSAALGAAGALAVLMAVSHVLSTVRTYLETLLQHRMANTIQERIMRKSVSLRLSQFEDAATYDSLQRANREASFRPYQIFANLIAVTSNLVSLISVSLVLLTWNPWVAGVIILAPFPSMAANIFYGRLGWKIENNRAADRRRATYLQYLVTTDRTFKETRLFDLGGLFVERFSALVNRFYAVDRRLEGRQAVASGALGLLSVAASAGAILFAAATTVQGGQVGQFAGYVMAITMVQSSVQMLFGSLAQMYEHSLFIGNLFAFLDLPVRDVRAGRRSFPERLGTGIEFREVSFTYPGTDTPVFEELNLFLPAGRCVALVGQNGAGKTTLVKLLARFYEPTSGVILVDGVPIEEYDIESLRRNLGVIFQDFVQYEASVRENVGFGRREELGNDSGILGAVGQAGAAEFVRKLSKGLETQLGRWFDGGHQLSGGQWQRIALARAFLRKAAVVVLDEPTASIDAQAEAEVFGRLKDIAGRATTLLIAHRFSTVRVADHIVVIDRGRVLEEGTHSELMALDNVYAKLFKLQASGYLDETAGLASGR